MPDPRIVAISAFNDNYIWALIRGAHNEVIIVDPGDAAPVLAFLNQYQLSLKAILITHKHHDHTGGISALLSIYPDAQVFSNAIEEVAQTTHYVLDGKIFSIDEDAFQVICIPGHTLGHVAYYRKPFLFCGDTLFTNGCGRIFEGTPEQMLSSLKKLMALPEDTQIYCGHEYTLSNIRFALHVEPSNKILQKRFEEAEKLRSENKPTVPSTIFLEKLTNPFLRCDQPEIIRSASIYTGKKLNSEAEVFSILREWKNDF